MDHFLENLVPLFGIVFTFGIPGVIIFFVFHLKHKERMRMIEKGFTPEEAKAFFGAQTRKVGNPYGSLKWGIVLTFVGLGFVISYIFTEAYDMSDSITFALVLLFGGLGFVLYYIIMSSRMKKENNMIAKNNQANQQ